MKSEILFRAWDKKNKKMHEVKDLHFYLSGLW